MFQEAERRCNVGRDDEGDAVHNTLFRSRPGDKFRLSNFVVRTASSGFVRDLVPPALYRAARRFWNRKN